MPTAHPAETEWSRTRCALMPNPFFFSTRTLSPPPFLLPSGDRGGDKRSSKAGQGSPVTRHLSFSLSSLSFPAASALFSFSSLSSPPLSRAGRPGSRTLSREGRVGTPLALFFFRFFSSSPAWPRQDRIHRRQGHYCFFPPPPLFSKSFSPPPPSLFSGDEAGVTEGLPHHTLERGQVPSFPCDFFPPPPPFSPPMQGQAAGRCEARMTWIGPRLLFLPRTLLFLSSFFPFPGPRLIPITRMDPEPTTGVHPPSFPLFSLFFLYFFSPPSPFPLFSRNRPLHREVGLITKIVRILSRSCSPPSKCFFLFFFFPHSSGVLCSLQSDRARRSVADNSLFLFFIKLFFPFFFPPAELVPSDPAFILRRPTVCPFPFPSSGAFFPPLFVQSSPPINHRGWLLPSPDLFPPSLGFFRGRNR